MSDPNEQRMNEVVRDHTKNGNVMGLVRVAGGSVEDFKDHVPGRDDGEPPAGAEWDLEEEALQREKSNE